nr:hypothetical protein [Tanacetum cinerariifolium]
MIYNRIAYQLRYVVPGRVIVPTCKVIVATGWYVVPTGRVIVPTGNVYLKRTGRDRDGGVIILPSTTAEEHITVQRESKARTTLLQSIPDDHSMFKQEFSKFRIGEAEGLHKGSQDAGDAGEFALMGVTSEFVPQAILLKTGKVNIPPARPQPVPIGKPKVFAPFPTGRPNRPFPVPTDRGYSPSGTAVNPQQDVLEKHIEKVYTGYPRTIVDLIHPHTDDNVADLLTKALDGPRVFYAPMLHLLRVEMVINSLWIMPISRTKELASLQQTAPGLASPRVSSYMVKAYQIYSCCCGSTHVAAMVSKHVAGSRFTEDSSMLLPFGVQCCWIEFTHADAAFYKDIMYVVPTGRCVVPAAKVQEVVEVVTAAKLVYEVTTSSETVTATSAIILATEPQVPATTITVAPSATSSIISAETKSKDKGKEIMVEEPKPLKKKQQIKLDEEYDRKLHEELNKDIDWDETIDHVKLKAKENPSNVAGFRLDYFKGIMWCADEDDDVYTEAAPLPRKVLIVDYKIIDLNNKPHYKIIRADETYQLYVSFLTLLRNFDREDLEALWSLVKEIFSTAKPKNFSDDFLLTTHGAMFETPNPHA